MEIIGFIFMLAIGLLVTLAGLLLMIGASYFNSANKSDRIVPLIALCIGVWCLYYAYTHSPWVLVARGAA